MATINDDRPIPGADLEAMFKPPPPPTGPLMDDETSPGNSPTATSTSPHPGTTPASPHAAANPKPGTPGDTRTPTSPTSARGDARAAGHAILAIVGALVLVVDALLVRSAGRRLRRPTRPQMDAFATPAGRLAYRHGAAAVLGDDVGDIVAMAGATADWMLDGPMTYQGPHVEYADDEPDDEPTPAGGVPVYSHEGVTWIAPPPPPQPPAAAGDRVSVTFLE